MRNFLKELGELKKEVNFKSKRKKELKKQLLNCINCEESRCKSSKKEKGVDRKTMAV